MGAEGRTGTLRGFVNADGSVDVTALRQHHRRLRAEYRRELKRRRELEQQCERLQRLVIEITVRWYGASGPGDETLVQLPGTLGGGSPLAFGGYLTAPPAPDDQDQA
jgi:hypothetical protein